MINSQIKRGDIVTFDFGPNVGSVQGGRRPAVVLQNDRQNNSSPTTIIAPLTTELKKPELPSHIILGRRFGLRLNSMVLLEQLTTVNKCALDSYIGHIDDPQIMRKINQGLIMTLGIQSSPCQSDSSSPEEVTV